MSRIDASFVLAKRLVALGMATLVAVGCGSSTPPEPVASAGASSAAVPASTPVSPRPEGGIPTLGDVAAYKGDPARTGVQAGPGPLATPDELWAHQDRMRPA